MSNLPIKLLFLPRAFLATPPPDKANPCRTLFVGENSLQVIKEWRFVGEFTPPLVTSEKSVAQVVVESHGRFLQGLIEAAEEPAIRHIFRARSQRELRVELIARIRRAATHC